MVETPGSGSIFEALRAKKALIVVANELLMDNHQLELAEALAEEGYLYHGSPASLTDTLKQADFGRLKQYPEPEVHKLVESLDDFLGYGSASTAEPVSGATKGSNLART